MPDKPNTGVVIWHVGRCGSSVLGHCYNQNPHMQWENEIFNRFMPQNIGTGNIPPLDIVISEVRERQQRDVQLIEVKFLNDQHLGIFGLTAVELAGVLRNHGYKHSVILERRNILRRMISHCLANETSIYHISSNESPPSRKSVHININKIQVGQSTRSLLDWLDVITASYRELKRSLRSLNGFLHLTYDDHIKTDPIVGYMALCDYLSIPRVPVQVKLRPTNPFPMSEIVCNYVELFHIISSTEHAWMLEEEEN